jgi:uncharacterized protein YaeQ
MALSATRLEYRITLSDVERAVDVKTSLIVAGHPSETREHVTLRVLAWCLFYEERLELGPGLSDPEVADLWVRDLTGKLTTWVECGTADPDKVRKVLQHNPGIAVHAVFAEPRRRDDLLAGIAGWKRPPRGADLSVWMIEPRLCDVLAAKEERRQTWTVTLVGGQAYVDADGDSLDGSIDRTRPLESAD